MTGTYAWPAAAAGFPSSALESRTGETPVGDQSWHAGKTILESKQARIVAVGSSEIVDSRSVRFRIANRLGKNEWHGSEAVVGLIRSAVFVDDGILKLDGEHRRNRSVV